MTPPSTILMIGSLSNSLLTTLLVIFSSVDLGGEGVPKGIPKAGACRVVARGVGNSPRRT
jgi:hypothetical protein